MQFDIKHPFSLARLPRPTAEWTRLFGLALVVGLAAGLAAAALEGGLHYGSRYLIGRFNPGNAELYRWRWMFLLLPAMGGLVSGLLVWKLCPGRSGHGTDILVRAFHHEGGALPLRGPLVKGVAAIGVISCGGSAGPEGPIAALGASLGSTFARVLGLTPRERRIMLIAGCGAAVGAIFHCPMGGALFAAGILYRDTDYETDAIVPAFIASVIGYTTYYSVWGQHFPLLGSATRFTFSSGWELIPYAVLGGVCAAFCIIFYYCLHFVERRPLARFNLPPWLAPAIGGVGTGLVACAVPQVMDGQYNFIRNAIENTGDVIVTQSPWQLVLLFGTVALAKCVATALTVGSGGSGGVLGPSVFIGGAAGAFVAALFQAIAPGLMPDELRQAMIPVGMAGVLSASMRVPLASIMIGAEMTGGYGLIVPSMLVCVSAYVLGRKWGLNDEQVRSSAESPAHAGDAVVHMLEKWRVRDLMQTDWPQTVSPGATLSEMVEKMQLGTRPVFAVVKDRSIVGLISVPDIERIMHESPAGDVIIAADMMTQTLSTVDPDDDAYHALTLMAQDNHIVTPVVTEDNRFVGMLSRHEVYAAVREQLDQMRSHLLLEHEGLAAIDREENLHQLVMGVAAPKTENIQRLLVPIQAVGRSLRESDFRREFGVQVIAVEMPDGTIQCPPDPDAPLQTSHRLVAIVLDAPQSPPQQDEDE